MARRLSFICLACFKAIRVSPKIRVLWTLWNFVPNSGLRHFTMVSHLCCQQNSSVVNLVDHTYDSCFANVTHSCAHNNNSQTTDSRTSRKSNDNSKLAAAVSSKLEAGNFRAAVWIISSSDTPAPTNQDTLNALRTKHPGPAHDELRAIPKTTLASRHCKSPSRMSWKHYARSPGFIRRTRWYHPATHEGPLGGMYRWQPPASTCWLSQLDDSRSLWPREKLHHFWGTTVVVI